MPRSLDITSTKNPLIRRIRALLDPEARKAEARMVVEGVRMLEEVLDAGVPVEVLVYDPHALAGPRGEALLDRARRHGARLVTAAPHVVAACSQVDTPQGLVAVVERSPAARRADPRRGPVGGDQLRGGRLPRAPRGGAWE